MLKWFSNKIKKRLLELGFTDDVTFENEEVAKHFLVAISQNNVKLISTGNGSFDIEYKDE